jgi:hypothetical protein
MGKTYPRGETKTREQREAEGEFYCDKTTPYNPPPQLEKLHHAEVREGSTELGETAAKQPGYVSTAVHRS